jgi:hypothetical protein
VRGRYCHCAPALRTFHSASRSHDEGRFHWAFIPAFCSRECSGRGSAQHRVCYVRGVGRHIDPSTEWSSRPTPPSEATLPSRLRRTEDPQLSHCLSCRARSDTDRLPPDETSTPSSTSPRHQVKRSVCRSTHHCDPSARTLGRRHCKRWQPRAPALRALVTTNPGDFSRRRPQAQVNLRRGRHPTSRLACILDLSPSSLTSDHEAACAVGLRWIAHGRSHARYLPPPWPGRSPWAAAAPGRG